MDEDIVQGICVCSPDTNVFILLLDVVSSGRLVEETHLKFLTGRGIKYRQIVVNE